MNNLWQDRGKLVKALTLTSPELSEERNKLEREETRKERVRDVLADLLPWETSEEESKILEEECRESILALSLKEETFLKSPLEDGVEPEEVLPSLLINFDLDMHVGLIQRLLDADEKLVLMQSEFSGGGDKEKDFWRNYFQRCALIRKKVGMNIDEIWGAAIEQEMKSSSSQSSFKSANENEYKSPLDGFSIPSAASKLGGLMNSVLADPMAKISALTEPKPNPNVSGKETTASNNNNEEEQDTDDSFEVIQKTKKGDDLDDLAAEIAKELEA